MNGYDELLPEENNTEQVPFETVMDHLFAGENVPIHHLYRLSDMSADEMAHFKREWASADLERRVTMVKHMSELAEDTYIVDFGPAFAFMFTDATPEIRQAALEGVWDSTDTSLIAPIIVMLQTDESIAVRASAARALAHYILLTEWGQLDERHTRAAVAALLASLDEKDTADEVRRAALEAVAAATHEPGITKHIQDAYDNGSTDFQLSALFAMGNSADSQWLPIVLEELANTDPDMRAEAARAAGSIGSKQAVQDLIDMSSDPEREVAEAAILALGQIGGDDAHQFLSQLAEDEDYADLHDAVDEALEEMDWAMGEFDLLSLEGDYDLDEDTLDDVIFDDNDELMA
ncbi:MAG: HEAT repeat domain-containing protein [Chloroflexota bacterium]